MELINPNTVGAVEKGTRASGRNLMKNIKKLVKKGCTKYTSILV